MSLLIGALAARAGVTTQTIRYYESLGVLRPAHRTAAGYRRYDEQALAELVFIKKAQGLGFSLDDIKCILDLGRAGRAPCSTVLDLAQQHISELDGRIQQLQQLRQQLAAAVQRWQRDGIPKDCASTLCGLIDEAADAGDGDARVTVASVAGHGRRSSRPPMGSRP